jgi:hypothetical protein
MAKKNSALEEIYCHYSHNPIPDDFESIVLRTLGVNLAAKYGPFDLTSPVLVAPGQLTTNTAQIKALRDAGFAGCVLKSVVGEDPCGNCSMSRQRRKHTFIKSVYDPDDKEGVRPIIHWNGGLDVRKLPEYLSFAREAFKMSSNHFFIAASFLAHLPLPEEDFLVEEWFHTARLLKNAGYRACEIDFCPFLKRENDLIDQKNVLRWYREIPILVKKAAPDMFIYPKLLNLDYGFEFQMRMAESAIEGGADGLVVANRFFSKEFDCAHGGKKLHGLNLAQVREICRRFPGVPVSATGGVYSGRDIFDYLSAGAKNVQVLSVLMGKVRKPFVKKGHKFEQVFHKLMLDPEDGLIACLLSEA